MRSGPYGLGLAGLPARLIAEQRGGRSTYDSESLESRFLHPARSVASGGKRVRRPGGRARKRRNGVGARFRSRGRATASSSPGMERISPPDRSSSSAEPSGDARRRVRTGPLGPRGGVRCGGQSGTDVPGVRTDRVRRSSEPDSRPIRFQIRRCRRRRGALFFEDFQSYAGHEDPEGWVDTAAENSLEEVPALFETFEFGDGNVAFGTSSVDADIHSHYLGAEQLAVELLRVLRAHARRSPGWRHRGDALQRLSRFGRLLPDCGVPWIRPSPSPLTAPAESFAPARPTRA